MYPQWGNEAFFFVSFQFFKKYFELNLQVVIFTEVWYDSGLACVQFSDFYLVPQQRYYSSKLGKNPKSQFSRGCNFHGVRYIPMIFYKK